MAQAQAYHDSLAPPTDCVQVPTYSVSVPSIYQKRVRTGTVHDCLYCTQTKDGTFNIIVVLCGLVWSVLLIDMC